jgi:hypothetical protein
MCLPLVTSADAVHAVLLLSCSVMSDHNRSGRMDDGYSKAPSTADLDNLEVSWLSFMHYSTADCGEMCCHGELCTAASSACTMVGTMGYIHKAVSTCLMVQRCWRQSFTANVLVLNCVRTMPDMYAAGHLAAQGRAADQCSGCSCCCSPGWHACCRHGGSVR